MKDIICDNFSQILVQVYYKKDVDYYNKLLDIYVKIGCPNGPQEHMCGNQLHFKQ